MEPAIAPLKVLHTLNTSASRAITYTSKNIEFDVTQMDLLLKIFTSYRPDKSYL